jgi:hypothetical protein
MSEIVEDIVDSVYVVEYVIRSVIGFVGEGDESRVD